MTIPGVATNRITKVSDGDGTIYANHMSYQPSGALAFYAAGNGLGTRTRSTAGSGWRRSTRGRSRWALHLDVGRHSLARYDTVCNVTAIDDLSLRDRDMTFHYSAAG